jgi:hypothetical protein
MFSIDQIDASFAGLAGGRHYAQSRPRHDRRRDYARLALAHALERDRRPDGGPAHAQAVPDMFRQIGQLDAVKHIGAPDVEFITLIGTQARIEALLARQPQGRSGALRRRRMHRQHAAERLAVVAQLHATVSLDALDADAVIGDGVEMRRDLRIALPGRARRRALRQPVGHAAYRIEGFGIERFGRRRLQKCGAIRDAHRLVTRRIAQEAHHRQQFRRIGRRQRKRAYLRRTDVPGPLAAMIVDLQNNPAFRRGFPGCRLATIPLAAAPTPWAPHAAASGSG